MPPSVTTDLWSNKTQQSFISFTLHFIDEAFQMHTRRLGAIPFEGEFINKVLFLIYTYNNYNILNIYF